MRRAGRRGPLLVLICGVTCGGKTTLARRLQRAYPGAVLLEQDDYFLSEDDPRHVPAPGIPGHANWDCASALDMERLVRDVMRLLEPERDGLETGADEKDACQTDVSGKPVVDDKFLSQQAYPSSEKNTNKDLIRDKDSTCDAENISRGAASEEGMRDHATPTQPACSSAAQLVIVEGFLAATDARLRRRAHLLWCLTLPRAVCWQRRRLRVYEPPDPDGYFAACVWPEYERALRQLRAADGATGPDTEPGRDTDAGSVATTDAGPAATTDTYAGPAATGPDTDAGPAATGPDTDTGPAATEPDTDAGPAATVPDTDTGPAATESDTDAGPAATGPDTDAGPAAVQYVSGEIPPDRVFSMLCEQVEQLLLDN